MTVPLFLNVEALAAAEAQRQAARQEQQLGRAVACCVLAAGGELKIPRAILVRMNSLEWERTDLRDGSVVFRAWDSRDSKRARERKAKR